MKKGLIILSIIATIGVAAFFLMRNKQRTGNAFDFSKPEPCPCGGHEGECTCGKDHSEGGVETNGTTGTSAPAMLPGTMPQNTLHDIIPIRMPNVSPGGSPGISSIKKYQLRKKKLSEIVNYIVSLFNGTSYVLATSPDGKIFKERKSGNYTIVKGAGIYLGYNKSGMITSPDGATWTILTVSGLTKELYSVTYANNLFVAVGGDGIFTSSDGATWTKLTVEGLTAALNSVTYANNLFVAVGIDGIFTSSDGATWTILTVSGLTKELYSVTYANNLFVAVGIDGIFTSSDGATWTKLPAGEQAILQMITA